MRFLIPCFMLLASAVRADYLYNARSTTQWQFVNTHTIILAKNGQPYALVEMPFCFILQLHRASKC